MSTSNSIIDNSEPLVGNENSSGTREWRSKDRVKTSASVITLCLHLGIDPPDVVRPVPGADNIAGITLPDPITASPGDQRQAAESIGNAIQGQFEYWQPRGHYRTLIDPPMEELKKVCSAARKSAKEERVLFYYSGWGVPKPTRNGEIWVFNSSYTQYLPLSLNELDSWLPGPVVAIFDCTNASALLSQWHKLRGGNNFYGFAATSDRLPNVPGLPGDLFTACLTTPLTVALKTAGKEVRGKLNDRSTPLGQLHWVFTAITDTIGWQQHDAPTFKELYRQDVLLASLFRNFLLAQRVMRMYGAVPTSFPDMPLEGNDLWTLWDCIVDRFANGEEADALPAVDLDDFFGDHLEAFERYLCTNRIVGEERKYPFLPIVLQMLLSQQHRVRALEALVTFMDLQGVWQCLDVGVYPYLLKLLHSGEEDSRDALSQIWLRLLLADRSTADDLKPQVIANFFVPQEAEDGGIFLACMYLIEQQLGPLGLTEDLVTDESIWYAILANKPHDDVWIMIHTDAYDASFTGVFDKDPLLRRYLARSLFRRCLSGTGAAQWLAMLKDLSENDPWPLVREEASKLVEIAKREMEEQKDDMVDTLAQKMERTRLEEEAKVEELEPIPIHLIRTRLLPVSVRTNKPMIISELGSEEALSGTLCKKLYEQVPLPNGNGQVEKIAFDRRLPNVLLLLYKGGRVEGLSYDTQQIIFSYTASHLKEEEEDIKATENGFVLRQGHVFFEFQYDLPLTLISTPVQVALDLKCAWRRDPACTPDDMTFESCDGITAFTQSSTRVVLQRGEDEEILEIPNAKKSGFFWNRTTTSADAFKIKSIAWHPTASLLAVCCTTDSVFLFH